MLLGICGLGYFAIGHFRPRPAGLSVADRTIAVLPFVDLSDTHDQEYFADGMAEEILDLLAKLPQLSVIGRTSSFQFKGRSEDLRNIGKVLGAGFVVEGSVRKSGDHLRVTAQLIDAHSGLHRWSQSYDRPVGDALTIQASISVAIARALELSITDLEVPVLRGRLNVEAYDELLKGRFALGQFSSEGFAESARHFERALQLEPDSASATAFLAISYEVQTEWGLLPPEEGFPKARDAALRAVSLDPSLGAPHAIIASNHREYDWDWQKANVEAAEALRLSPRDSLVLTIAGLVALSQGHFQEAVRFSQTAQAQDPLFPAATMTKCYALERLELWDQAEAAVRHALEIAPDYADAHYYLGEILLARGKAAEALVLFDGERQLSGLGGQAMAYYALHENAKSDAALQKMLKLQAQYNAFGIAEVYAFEGRSDDALQWLERAYQQKDIDLTFVSGDPAFKQMRGDPRLSDFLTKRLNLAQ